MAAGEEWPTNLTNRRECGVGVGAIRVEGALCSNGTRFSSTPRRLRNRALLRFGDLCGFV